MADVLKEQGRGEGEERGREQGRAEAQIDTARSTLLRQLQKRFGELPKSVAETIRPNWSGSTSGSTGS